MPQHSLQVCKPGASSPAILPTIVNNKLISVTIKNTNIAYIHLLINLDCASLTALSSLLITALPKSSVPKTIKMIGIPICKIGN